MNISHSYSYPAGIERVDAMLADPESAKQRFAVPGLTNLRTDTRSEAGSVRTVATGDVDPSAVPAKARRFVGARLSATLTESWGPREGDTRHGTLDVEVSGAPVSLHATSTLRGSGEQTQRTLEGDLTVAIPLIGRRIEERAKGLVPRIARADAAAAQAYLAAHAQN